MTVLLGSAPGGAEERVRRDPALAEALFQESIRLMDRGEHAAACPKLEESQSLDPAPGTLLRLALCHELVGKTATAWAEFHEALSWAKQDRRRDRIAFAEQHIADLKPRLSTLKVVVPQDVASLPGLVVERNGVAIGPAAFGVAAPVDPGTYRVSASALGHEPAITEVVVEADGHHETVQIGDLRPVPQRLDNSGGVPTRSVSTQPHAAPDRREHSRTQGRDSSLRALGYGLSAIGAVAVNVGLYFGLRTIIASGTVHELCPRTPCDNLEGVRASEQANRDAWIADAALAIGAVGLGAGGYLLFVRPAAETRDDDLAGVSRRARPYGAIVSAEGTF